MPERDEFEWQRACPVCRELLHKPENAAPWRCARCGWTTDIPPGQLVRQPIAGRA